MVPFAEVGTEARWPRGVRPRFTDENLLETLESVALPLIDDLDFGLIVIDRHGDVIAYNAYESRRAGIDRRWVLGGNLFEDVGPCTNNQLVAAYFREHERGVSDLDEQLDYVFPFRMAPAPVRLRLLARAASPRRYLAVVPW